LESGGRRVAWAALPSTSAALTVADFDRDGSDASGLLAGG
jgi:hypothetical protein